MTSVPIADLERDLARGRLLPVVPERDEPDVKDSIQLV
jgi:hypothetical protein